MSYVKNLPWKSRVLARTLRIMNLLSIVEQYTHYTHNILTPQFPCPRTLTNHICVSDIRGPIALLYRPDTARVLYIG